MALPIIPAVIAGGALVSALIRPSTAMRLIEDAAIGTVKGVARGTSNVVRGTKIEYRARKIAAARREIERESEALRTLSEEELLDVAQMQAAVMARAEELIAQRNEPTYYARRAKAGAKLKRRGFEDAK